MAVGLLALFEAAAVLRRRVPLELRRVDVIVLCLAVVQWMAFDVALALGWLTHDTAVFWSRYTRLFFKLAVVYVFHGLLRDYRSGYK